MARAARAVCSQCCHHRSGVALQAWPYPAGSVRGSGTAAAVGGCCRRGAIDGDAALAAEAAQQRTQLVGQRVVLLCDRNVIAQQRVIAGCVQVRQAGWGSSWAGAMLRSARQGVAGVGLAPDAHELSVSVAAITTRSLGMGLDVPLQGVELFGVPGLVGQAL